MTLQTQFDKAVFVVPQLPGDGPVKPNQKEQLFFYSRYKQATIGDVNTSRPESLDFVAKAKWDAWKEIEGMSKETAQKEYVAKLIDMLKKADHKASRDLGEEIEGLARL